MPGADQNDLVWLEIDDFTPGIITNSATTYSPTAGGNTGPVPGSKSGQAQSAVGCIALPNGGLAPLPGLITPLPPTHTPPSSPVVTFINGLFVQGPVYTGIFPTQITPNDSIVYGQEEYTPSSDSWTWFLENILATEGVFNITQSLKSLGPTTGSNTDGAYITMTGDTTRTSTVPAGAGLASLVVGYYWHPNLTTDTTSYILLTPDPTDTSTSVPYELSTAGYFDVICHQNRIIALGTIVQNWANPAYSVLSNELFDYTDPPNSLSLGTQGEVFVQEHPFGNGAWGSISASELFLVKHSGGGYVIQGDLNAPTVTRLPGVTSSYGLMSRGGDTPLGFVYASSNRGLWAWNGGNTSIKVSNQLDDNFFINPDLPNPVYHGPTVDVRGWGDWIVVTNDWVMDTNTGGWWKLSPSSTGQSHLFYGVAWNADSLYASVPKPSSTVAIDVYSRGFPSTLYTWMSYPMRLSQGSNDRQYSIQEVVVRAQGNGTVTILLTGFEGSTSSSASSPSESLTFETTTDTSQPRMQAIRTGIVAQDITISITSTAKPGSGSPAPVVYSVAVGYVEQQQVSST